MREVSVAVLCAIGVFALTGCGHSSRRDPIGLGRTNAIHFPVNGVTFRYPTAWSRRNCQRADTVGAPLTFLATVKPAPLCSNSGWRGLPKHLGDDEVSVEWYEGGIAAKLRDFRGFGRATRIGGQPARVAFQRVTSSQRQSMCAEMGGQQTVEAVIEPFPSNSISGELIWMTACLRGPDFGANETAVRNMLSSLQLSATQD